MARALKIGTMMIRRTIMSDELSKLFQYKPDLRTTLEEYSQSIFEDNCLAKISMSARKLTVSYLKELYALDTAKPEFSLFKVLWHRNTLAQKLLALQYAYLNDAVIRDSVSYFLSVPIGAYSTTKTTQQWVERTYPNRFSMVTACSIAKDLNSSWCQAGYFKGVRPRIRITNSPVPENVVFALYLGFLSGKRGMGLFENEFTRLLELSTNALFTSAESAARQGLLVFRHLGDVVDVQFPSFPREEVKK